MQTQDTPEVNSEKYNTEKTVDPNPATYHPKVIWDVAHERKGEILWIQGSNDPEDGS